MCHILSTCSSKKFDHSLYKREKLVFSFFSKKSPQYDLFFTPALALSTQNKANEIIWKLKMSCRGLIPHLHVCRRCCDLEKEVTQQSKALWILQIDFIKTMA